MTFGWINLFNALAVAILFAGEYLTGRKRRNAPDAEPAGTLSIAQRALHIVCAVFMVLPLGQESGRFGFYSAGQFMFWAFATVNLLIMCLILDVMSREEREGLRALSTLLAVLLCVLNGFLLWHLPLLAAGAALAVCRLMDIWRSATVRYDDEDEHSEDETGGS
ncbi:MAG: hypothetical protein IJH78_01610 [Clostridia bacterium]|nr:hypothetical protein [Clostridia bacterium]